MEKICNFSKKLKKLRKNKKMSQETLAEKLEVSRQTIYNWENNYYTPKINEILMICDIFECELSFLINDNNNILE